MKKLLSIILATVILTTLMTMALVTPAAREVVIYSMPFTMEATQEPIGGWFADGRPFWAGESNDGARYGRDPINEYTTMGAAADEGGGLRFWRDTEAIGGGDFQRNPVMINYISINPEEWIHLHLDTPMTIDIDLTQGPNFAQLQPQDRSINAFFVFTFGYNAERHSFLMNRFLQNHLPSHQETWGIIKGEFTPREMLEAAVADGEAAANEAPADVGNHVDNREQQGRMAERILSIADENDGFMPIYRIVLFAAVDHADYHEYDVGPDNFGIIREFSFGIDRDTLPPGQEELIGEGSAAIDEPEVSEEPADDNGSAESRGETANDGDGLSIGAIIGIGAGAAVVAIIVIVAVLMAGKKKEPGDDFGDDDAEIKTEPETDVIVEEDATVEADSDASADAGDETENTEE